MIGNIDEYDIIAIIMFGIPLVLAALWLIYGIIDGLIFDLFRESGTIITSDIKRPK